MVTAQATPQTLNGEKREKSACYWILLLYPSATPSRARVVPSWPPMMDARRPYIHPPPLLDLPNPCVPIRYPDLEAHRIQVSRNSEILSCGRGKSFSRSRHAVQAVPARPNHILRQNPVSTDKGRHDAYHHLPTRSPMRNRFLQSSQYHFASQIS